MYYFSVVIDASITQISYAPLKLHVHFSAGSHAGNEPYPFFEHDLHSLIRVFSEGLSES